MTQTNIPIIFGINNSYAMPMAVALKSLIINYKGDKSIIVFILYRDVSNKNRKMITRSFENDKVELNWIPSNKKVLSLYCKFSNL